MTEDEFLQDILENPSDDDRLLIFADWLEDQGEDLSITKAEFLRRSIEYFQSEDELYQDVQSNEEREGFQQFVTSIITAVQAGLFGKRREPSRPENEVALVRSIRQQRERLQYLASLIDPPWLMKVSRLWIENCPQPQTLPPRDPSNPLISNYLCERRWHQLQTTGNQAVRFCDGCQKKVYYCKDLEEAQDHATEEHCVAIDLSVKRMRGDLNAYVDMLMGDFTVIDADDLTENDSPYG